MDRFPNWKSGELLLEQELQPAHRGGRTARFYSIRYCITPTFPTRKSIGVGDYIRPLGTCQLFIYSALRPISAGLWNEKMLVSQGFMSDVRALLFAGKYRIKWRVVSMKKPGCSLFTKEKTDPTGKEAYSGTSRWRR